MKTYDGELQRYLCVQLVLDDDVDHNDYNVDDDNRDNNDDDDENDKDTCV